MPSDGVNAHIYYIMWLLSLHRICAVLLFIAGLNGNMLAQYSLDEFSLKDGVNWYDKNVGEANQEVFTGQYHQLERKSRDTHAYFHKTWQPSGIRYRGKVYEHVPLLYDLELDVVLTINMTHPEYAQQPIRLIQYQVDWFVIDDSKFVFLANDSTGLPEGFFMAIYEGSSVSMYEKVSKSLVLKDRQPNYEAYSTFYLKVGKEFIKVSRASHVAKIFDDKAQEVKQIGKALRIRRFSKTPVSWLNQFGSEINQILEGP